MQCSSDGLSPLHSELRRCAMSDRARSTVVDETERVRGLWDKAAPRFDRMMGFWEKVLFAGGREWACSQASGDVLEIAVGSGRTLPYYPRDARLTAIELSP